MSGNSLPAFGRKLINGGILLGGAAMIMKELFERVQLARRTRENQMLRRKSGMLAVGVSIGCTVGAIAGVLFAPKAGKETREEVGRRGRETWEKIKDNASSTGHRLAQVVEAKGAQVCDAAEKCVDVAKEVMHEPDKKIPEKNPNN